jgi:hypothetical protein
MISRGFSIFSGVALRKDERRLKKMMHVGEGWGEQGGGRRIEEGRWRVEHRGEKREKGVTAWRARFLLKSGFY